MFKSPALKRLRHRIYWTIFFLFIYMLGIQTPLPYATITRAYRRLILRTPVNWLSFYTGANYSNLSVFMIGLNPMMVGMILVQVLSTYRLFGLDALSARQMNIFQQTVILLLAIIQASTITFAFGLTRSLYQALSVIIILVAGSFFVMWIGQLNGRLGIGGTIVIILVNILMGTIPAVRGSATALLGIHNGRLWVGLLIIVGILVARFWLAFCRAYYPIPMVDTNLSSRDKPIIMPLGLNMGAMMMIMIGMVILMAPVLFAGYFPNTGFFTNPTFLVIYGGTMDFLLFYFFTFMQLRPLSTARGMRAGNSYFLHVRPGRQTQLFLRHRIWEIGLLGAILNSASMVFGMLGPRYMGRYAGFATIPMTTMMVIMFMYGIMLQIELYYVPRRYEKFIAKENRE